MSAGGSAEEGIADQAAMPEAKVVTASEDIPLGTRRAFDDCMDKFVDRLEHRVWSLTQERGTSTPTSREVEDAFRSLTAKSSVGKTRLIVGQIAVVLGGLTIGLASTHLAFLLIGLLVIGLGIFVREWPD